MKKNRFLFVAMLFAALSLGFASCDNKGNEPDDPQIGNTEQEEKIENNSEGDKSDTKEPITNTEIETSTTGAEIGYDWVDLDLSVKWATCNVGATTPEGYGDYFAWGETTKKSEYTLENYEYAETSVVLPVDRDAAATNMGGKWRMPTALEIVELWEKCTWTPTFKNAISGYEIKSKTNNNSIFLPAAGFYEGSECEQKIVTGGYWSSSIYLEDNDKAHAGFIGETTGNNCSRFVGLPIRAVLDK